MPLTNNTYRSLRSMLLNSIDLPQACDLEFQSPQTEITVWLHGLGERRDVTLRHSVACAVPFMFCIGFDDHVDHQKLSSGRLSLRFCERGGKEQLLGEIGLQLSAILPLAGAQLYLFKAVSCTNFCLSRPSLWAYHLYHSYKQRKKQNKLDDVKVSPLDSRCNAVTFICPRPVVLVSLRDEKYGSIFPMNLLGTVGRDYFVFALNSKKQAASLVEHLGKLAISNIPLARSSAARQLSKNHYRQTIDWEELPFKTYPSKVLDIPVPEFALRVRELKVLVAQPLGSHSLFVTRIIGEEVHAIGPEFCMVHGLYEARRRKQNLLSAQFAST